MRLSLPALAALLMVALPHAASAQDGKDACDQHTTLQEALACWGARVQSRPLDKEDLGYACTNVADLQFKRPGTGKRVLAFGERTQFGLTSTGVVIETPGEASIVAPFDAVVTFANEYRSYGRLIVLELGCGMSFLLAGLGEVAVSPGQMVAAGEPVGFMSAAKAGDEGKPVLYVELRRDGRPIDPGSDIAGD